MVNGQNTAPGQEYQSSEKETLKIARDDVDAPAGKIAFDIVISERNVFHTFNDIFSNC